MTNNFEEMDFESIEKLHELSRMEAALIGFHRDKKQLQLKLEQIEKNIQLQIDAIAEKKQGLNNG